MELVEWHAASEKGTAGARRNQRTNSKHNTPGAAAASSLDPLDA
jgi:hypothetical protein